MQSANLVVFIQLSYSSETVLLTYFQEHCIIYGFIKKKCSDTKHAQVMHHLK